MSTYKNNSTENFYREVINRVCETVKEDFMNEGIAEDVLSELKKVYFFNCLELGRQIDSKWNFPTYSPNTQFCRIDI